MILNYVLKMRPYITALIFSYALLASSIALSEPTRDTVRVSPPLTFAPDTSFVGEWEGQYLDLNKGLIKVIFRVDSCNSNDCFGNYSFDADELRAFHASRSTRGTELSGRLEYGYKFQFSLRCFVQSDILRD